MKIQLALTMAILLAVAIGALASEYFDPTPSEPQLYTVHFDGIDYQDLSLKFTGPPPNGLNYQNAGSAAPVQFFVRQHD